jgi:phage terminase large subunit-like protein
MPETLSLASSLSSRPEAERLTILKALSNEQAKRLLWDWSFWARPKQLPPPGDWATWLIRAGRGFGKTRAGSGWAHQRAMDHPGRWIALVARTPADARDYMIEGPGGFLRNTPPWERPKYESSKRRLTWPNGSWATIYSDEEPDQLRGFSGDTAWLDEFAKFKNAQDGWDNLQFGMREISADRPRRLITTTPRPIPVLRKIMNSPLTVTVAGTSHENAENLDPSWYSETLAAYEGTRLGRQEIFAEILDDVPGALWTRELIDNARKPRCLPDMARVVVAVDPSGTRGAEDGGDWIGIVVAGKGVDGRGYVLADRSCKLSPAQWGRRAVDAYREFSADRIIAERNYGGAMVEHVIRSTDRNVSYSEVTASRGKIVRAEPVSALYEQKHTDGTPCRITHIGKLDQLEDQMCQMSRDGYIGEGSPDRCDALVWALTELMLGRSGGAFTAPIRGGF